jgi:hypothetical protein
MSTPASITVRRQDGATLTVRGRDGWALQQLIVAGLGGCTPLTHPGPRWSAYVHKLRRAHGLDIATLDEAHGGAFPGRHARYVLGEHLEILGASGGAEVS